MKTKAFIFLLAFSFIAQVLLAQKTGLLFHSITIKLPQFAGLNLSSNSKPIQILKKRNNNTTRFKSENLWLNYHSITKGDHLEPSKNIKAQLTKGNLNNNLTLSLIALNDIGKGNGIVGKASNKNFELNKKNAFKIIDNIGIGYTGKGAFEGHNIIYFLTSKNINNTQLNKNISNNLTVTYTFFDN